MPIQRYREEKPLVLKREQIRDLRGIKDPTLETEPEEKKEVVVVKKKKETPPPKEEKPQEKTKDDGMMMFTDSEDDSVDSEEAEDLPLRIKRLMQVFWRSRNWVILNNQGLLKVFVRQQESFAPIYTPISPDTPLKDDQKDLRWVGLSFKLSSILKNLVKNSDFERAQPLMMQFMAYLSSERSQIPADFLLPLESKLIPFKDNRQRDIKDPRDTKLLVGCFMFCKVIAGKIFFKPYKLSQYFDLDVNDLERPVIFKENCLSIGYAMIALFTDIVFELFKVELARLEQSNFKKKEDILNCKKRMF